MATRSETHKRAMEAQASARKAVHEMLVRKAKLGEYVIIADKDGNPLKVKAEEALKLAEEEAVYDASDHQAPPQSNE